MTEKEIEALKFELKQKLHILKIAKNSAVSSAESATEKRKEKAIKIIESRRIKDENAKEIEKQELIEEYYYEKGKQHAYEHIINLL